MSLVSDQARVWVLLADFANADAAGKLNMIGANWTVIGFQPNGLTAPQALVVLIEVPSTSAGETFAVSLTLMDDTNTPVQVPGQPEALRISQVVTAQRPAAPGFMLPPDLPCKVQLAFGFPGGLPLQSARAYHWQVEIDGNGAENPDWSESFFVLGPPPQPVIG